MNAHEIAASIVARYEARYRGEIQGCCPVIADEIASATGGVVVAGWLTWYGGSCRRSHWWVDLDGVVLDPWGERFLAGEEYAQREEAHRDRAVFEAILPEYEVWRVVP